MMIHYFVARCITDKCLLFKIVYSCRYSSSFLKFKHVILNILRDRPIFNAAYSKQHTLSLIHIGKAPIPQNIPLAKRMSLKRMDK